MTTLTTWRVVFLFLPTFGEGQVIHYDHLVPDARVSAQFSASAADALVTAFQPALMSPGTGFATGLFAEKKYNVAELALWVAAARFQLLNSSIGITLSRFGGSLYSEKLVLLNYGRSFGKINSGVQLGMFDAKTRRGAVYRGVFVSWASVWKMSERIRSAVQFRNPQSFWTRRDSAGTRPAASFTLGMGYDISDQLYVGFESGKEERRSAASTILMRFVPLEQYIFRAAWNTATHQPFFSCAWQTGSFSVEAGFRYHAALGLSPVVVLLYDPKRRDK